MRFSVIVPVYNVEKYLEQCIESILNSKCEEIEVILVNDGSTDGSSEICNRYAKKDNRVNAIHKKNGGLSSARNKGIEEATGEYIMFLDSDDYIINDIFTTINTKNLESDLILYNYRYEDCLTNSIYKSKLEYSGMIKKIYTGLEVVGELLNKMPMFDWYAWQFLVKRELIINNNFKFKEGLLYEDIDLVPNIIISAKHVQLKDVEVINYRINRKGAITQSVKLRPELDRLNIASEKIVWVNRNIKIPELREKLNNNFAAMLFTAMIKYFYLPKQDRRILRERIKEKSSIGSYMNMNTYKIIYNFYKIFGLRITAVVLYLRSKMRKG